MDVYGDIERMAVLKSIDIFKELEIESLYQILKVAKYIKFAKDEMIMKVGEMGESFYVILEGNAGVLIDGGKEMITTISQGDIVGELSMLDKKERTASIIALDNILALEFEGEAFVDLIKNNNAIAFAMARTLSHRLRNTLRTRKNNI